ncbi:MAG TPA: HD domain-containing protein [Anaeromyxobacter sp.]
MNDDHRSIYLRAREYWNTRFNDLHVPVAYAFARELLLAHPGADRDVVVPAILLHDVGWKSIPEDRQLRAFGVEVRDEALRRFHETEGARIAAEILSAVGVAPGRRDAIVRIIDGHDTRLEALSLEDALVKDADKLWRFTPAAIDIDHRRFRMTLGDYLPWLGRQLERIFLTARAAQIASDHFARVHRCFSEAGHV